MKRVISNQELKEKMIIAIDILCNTVKTTLGPKGSNVIIDNSSFSPFITNDGVTIAENIESEDEIINAILEIAKESSIKTNENVGDGTTTTLVLLQSIFKEGQKLIEAGMNPIALKKELNNLLPDLIKFINNKSYLPQDSDLYKIAEISSNSKEIGQIITEAFLKVKKPILGICRGHQIINIYYGGSLIQDIPSQYETNINHRQNEARHVGTHTVTLTKDSILGNKGEVHSVNTFHHQNIDKLGDTLEVVAVSEDGLIEAVQNEDVFGIQWHPECMIQDAFHRNIIQTFVNKCKR